MEGAFSRFHWREGMGRDEEVALVEFGDMRRGVEELPVFFCLQDIGDLGGVEAIRTDNLKNQGVKGSERE